MVNSSAVRRLAKRVRGASGRASMIATPPSQPLLPDATASSPATASAAAPAGVGDTNGRTTAREPSISSVPVSRSPSTMSKSASIETGVEKSNRSSNRSSNHSSETRLSSELSAQSPQSPQSLRTGSSASADMNKKPQRLKSQYPRNANEKHVEYILVASFHIDRGPILENQYPGAIKGDQHMLAELMLPDQAHVRNQDWTIFFLHKDTSAERHDNKGEQGSGLRVRKTSYRQDGDISPTLGSTASRKSDEHTADARSYTGDSTESEEGAVTDPDEEGEGDLGRESPLVYVLNLVNTKQDVSAKRGAVVKAMAICTRHSFLHIYKPLLLLALEEYFKAPVPDTLATLYNAVNAMDLSLMPRLSILEGYILQATDAKDLFMEKFAQMIQQRMEEEGEGGENTDSPPSPNRTSDDASRRVNGNQLLSRARYSLPRDTHEFESKVIYNGIRIPIKVPTALYPETVGGFSLIKLIQAFSAPHAKDPQPFMLHAHLTTSGPFTHPIIVLVNAMLTQKRVIFLGHNRPSGEVAEAVLAACALASGGVLRGFTRHAFPYTDLSKIDDLLKVLGFIAGVTNPAFAHHPEWWDLLCDITTGRMKISHRIEPAPITEGYVNFQQQSQMHVSSSGTSLPSAGSGSSGDPTGDQAFMEHILHSIVSRHGESVIRAKWRDWIVKFTRIAAAFEESVYGASTLCIGGEEGMAEKAGIIGHGYVWSDEASRQRELGGNVFRIEGWRNTRSYYHFIQDLARQYSMRPVKSLDLHHLHDRLRTQKLSAADSAAIYLALASCINTYTEICQLLTATPESHAGLFYISLGLFHPRPDVRTATWHLLERIREHMAGRHFWNSLNQFAKLAFFRQQRQMLASGEGAAPPPPPQQQQQQQQASVQTSDGGSKERGDSG